MISAVMHSNTSALEYQTNASINFTINPSINVSVSGDLAIDELAPNTSSDSNSIVVNVLTNNANGYQLSSSVGNNVDTNPSSGSLIHNTTDLVHNTVSSNVFSSLAYGSSVAGLSDFNPSTWGYSYATYNPSTSDWNSWSNYSGLPLFSDINHVTILSEKYVPSDDNIAFKIAARADSTQAAGDYTNTINFIATVFPYPMSLSDSYAYFNKTKVSVVDPSTGVTNEYYTMQDMEPGICATAEDLSTLTVVDIRDNNIYTIAKLADHRCWMTTNLNLEGGTQLSSEDTDMADDWVMPTANGFGENNTLPASSTEGFSDGTVAYLYNSNKNDPLNCSSPGCYSYYSWTTATLGSGINISTVGENAPYSLCPKNWHLPTSSRTAPYANNSDFYNLLYAYGLNNGDYMTTNSEEIATIYNNMKKDSIPNYVTWSTCPLPRQQRIIEEWQ